jgi:hypothetical protein
MVYPPILSDSSVKSMGEDSQVFLNCGRYYGLPQFISKRYNIRFGDVREQCMSEFLKPKSYSRPVGTLRLR